MLIGEQFTIESPGHKHLDYQEDDDGRDVVLDGQDIMPMLDIEETPVPGFGQPVFSSPEMLDPRSNGGIDDGDTPVEGQFGNLGCRKLPIGIPKFDTGRVLHVDRRV